MSRRMTVSKKGWMEYEVTGEDAGLTVERVVRERLQVSGRMLQRLTRSKGILLNRKAPFLQRQVKAGDRVAIRITDQPSSAAVGGKAGGAEREGRVFADEPRERLPLDILYEDEHLLIVNKPAGLMVHPVGPDQSGTLVDAIAARMRERGEPEGVHPVHRLDKETSGAILVAKTGYGHQLADRVLREGSLRREYLAVACGRMAHERGTIHAPIGRDHRHKVRRRVTDRGEEAITHYEVVAAAAEATLVRVWLETGRTHQIRVHFQHIGHPLAGDAMYGGRRDLLRRQALHARRLSFAHPLTGAEISCEAPLPDDLASLTARLFDSPPI
ncbi:RluA family pseudouridine synthase [Brevibacillus composti]|nr:RluA family pseudouridine synthase [Brevibacillus composti]